MADELPEFVPKESPGFFLIDPGHVISASSVETLKPIVASANYAPKLVILPVDYVSPNSAQLTQTLVKQWNINAPGKTFLVVVDMKGHKVHAHGSPELAKAGITSDYITNNLIPNQFVPSMKKGDLTSAIRLTLTDVGQKQSEVKVRAEQAVKPVPEKVPVQPMSDLEVNTILILLLIVPIAFTYMIVAWVKKVFFTQKPGSVGTEDTSLFGRMRSRSFWNGGGHTPLGSWNKNPVNDYDSSHHSSSSSSSSGSSSSSSSSSSGSDGSGSW